MKRFKVILISWLLSVILMPTSTLAATFLENQEMDGEWYESENMDWYEERYEYNKEIVESWGDSFDECWVNVGPYITDLSNEIVGNESDDYEKLKKIYRWVTANIKYDKKKVRQPMYALVVTDDVYERFAAEGLNAYMCTRAEQAAVLRKGICMDFAWLVHDLLMAQNIPSRFVSGEMMNHAWNAVYIGGQWYFLDATWDNGKEEEDWDYFTPSLEEFSYSHIVD